MTHDETNGRAGGALGWVKANIVPLAFGLSLIFFVAMQVRLLDYFIWNDEAETVVTADMMAAGSRLYTQIFNHHGPMTFFTGYLVALVSEGGIVGNRIVIMILQWALLAVILRSAEIPARARMFLFLCMAVTLTGPLRDVYAHMYTYQVLAGLCSAAAISLYVLPRMLGKEQSFAGTLVTGLCLGVLPFMAFTYIPGMILLLAAGFSRKSWKPLLIGLVAMTALSVAFTALKASFDGFIAYHFYMNLVVLPPYIGGFPGVGMVVLRWFSGGGKLIGILSAAFVLGAAWRLYRNERASWVRILLLLLVFASYSIRGRGFHGVTFYYSALPLGTLFAAPLERLFRERAWLGWAMVAVLLVKLSGFAPLDRKDMANRSISKPRPFPLIVDAYTQPGDKVISYSFNNFDYLAAHRLPASSHFFYLPWQPVYNLHPYLGVKSDACAEIAAYRPKIMQLDKWQVFDKYDWAGYAGCIDRIVARDYVQLPGTIIYARKDIHVSPEMIRRAAAMPY